MFNDFSKVVVALWIIEAGLDLTLSRLNLGTLGDQPPPELNDIFTPEKYKESLDYFRVNARFGQFQEVVSLALLLGFFFLGGFAHLARWADSFGHGPIATGLIFIGSLSLLKSLSQLPFSIWHTFKIEARFGFNRTTPKTFVLDLIKGLVVGAILGGILLSGCIQVFKTLGDSAWWIAWLSFTVFTVALTFLAPAFLLPLFNKFTPIPEGALRDAVGKYSKAESFTLQGVYVMDGSKRSSKSNAFFTGFGGLRRLVLFDTLMERFNLEETMAVVAHEAGHFKRGHIPKMIMMQLVVTLALFGLLGYVFKTSSLHEAFGFQQTTIHGAIVIAILLYSPVMRFLSLIPNAISRKHEYEADEFSVRTYKNGEALISALRKLAAENFAHLTPHPLKVLFDYTHPPMRERILEIRRLLT